MKNKRNSQIVYILLMTFFLLSIPTNSFATIYSKGSLIESETNLKTVVWKQTFEFSNNKSIKLDLNNDKKNETVEIGMATQLGNKVTVLMNGSGFNLFDSSSICKSEFAKTLFEDGGSDLAKGISLQAAFIDFDNDKKPEIIIAAGDKSTVLAVSVFKLVKTKSKTICPYKEIGYFEGQQNILIEKNKNLSAPYGSQGLFTEYQYKSGKIVQISK